MLDKSINWVMVDSAHREEYLALRPDMAGRVTTTAAEDSALAAIEELYLMAPGAQTLTQFPQNIARCHKLKRLVIGPGVRPSVIAALHAFSLPPQLKALGIFNGGQPTKWPAKVCLPNLDELHTDGPMRFTHTNFPNLRRASLRPTSDNANLQAVLSCAGLIELQLINVTSQHLFSTLAHLPLEKLGLRRGKLTSLVGIEALPTLKWFAVHDLRSLTSVAALSGLPQLQELQIHYCKRISDITSIAKLSTLRRLQLIGCGRLGIKSLEPFCSGLEIVQTSATQ